MLAGIYKLFTKLGQFAQIQISDEKYLTQEGTILPVQESAKINHKRKRDEVPSTKLLEPAAKKLKTDPTPQVDIIKISLPAQEQTKITDKRKHDELQDTKLLSEPPTKKLKTKPEKNLPKTLTLKAFEHFIDNIQKAKLRTHDPKLLKLITPQDLDEIFDYFITINQHNKKQMEFNNELRYLVKNSSLRLDKKDTKLPRTLTILRTEEGEFKLILETKSKLASGAKQILPQIGGAYKRGKPAWQIDTQEKEYFNLVSILDTPEDIKDLMEEVSISQKLACAYVDSKHRGTLYEKKKGLFKLSVYSEKAIGNLHELITHYSFKYLSLEKKYNLLLDIFYGVAAAHQKNLVHQDIKPANILAYGNKETGYYAKVTDFGLTTVESDNSLAKATIRYQSPEITYCFKEPQLSDKDANYLHLYFNCIQFLPTLGHQYLNTQGPHLLKRPHKANDMWALGILAFEVLNNGALPLLPYHKDSINNNPLLKGLLEPTRAKRFTIEQAINVARDLKDQACNAEIKNKKYCGI